MIFLILQFDLHIHSRYSKDSKSSIDSIISHAIAIGLNGIAITDHDTVAGGLSALERVEEIGYRLIIIPGIEVSTKKGHLIVLGVQEDIPKKLSPQKTIEIARDIGGIIISPHPFHLFRHPTGKVDGFDIDAIEVYNSRHIFGYANSKARKMAENLKKPMVAGSDAHAIKTIGRAITEIDSAPTTTKILSAICAGKTKVQGKRAPLKVFAREMVKGGLKRAYKVVKTSLT